MAWGGRWSGGWFGLLVEAAEPAYTVTAGPLNEERATEAMTAHWLASWSAVPSTLDGEAFEALPSWSRFSVIHFDREQHSTGATRRRVHVTGRIAVQVFGAIDQGVATVAGLADEVRIALESQRIATPGDVGILTAPGAARRIETDGRWHAALVVVPFAYFETR